MASTTRVPARFTLAHGLMVLAGLMTFVLVVNVLKDKSEKVEVLVAAADFNAGRIETTTVQVDASDPLLPAIAKPGDFVEGMFVRRQLAQGDPILLSDLVLATDAKFQRTFNFELTDTQLDGLKVQAGDLVDVIGVEKSGAVVFVATGRPVVRVSDGSSGSLGGIRKPNVTLGVSDLDAVRISAAWRNDDLHLVRSTGATPVDGSLTMDRAEVNLSLLAARQGLDFGLEAEAVDPQATTGELAPTGLEDGS